MALTPTVARSRCGPGALTLTASGAVGTQTYAWYTQPAGGTPIPNESDATFTTPVLTESTSYYVAVASSNGEGERTEVQAVILSLPAQPEISVTGLLNCPDENIPTILEAPGGFAGYLWSTGETTSQIEVVAAGAYSVQVVDANACISIASGDLVVTEESCDRLIVCNAISPDNGDDINDHLIIGNITRSPETWRNKLRIFNRWGDVVFEISDYDNVNNVFRGERKDGRKLSSGTYFYVLEFESGRAKMSAYILIRR